MGQSKNAESVLDETIRELREGLENRESQAHMEGVIATAREKISQITDAEARSEALQTLESWEYFVKRELELSAKYGNPEEQREGLNRLGYQVSNIMPVIRKDGPDLVIDTRLFESPIVITYASGETEIIRPVEGEMVRIPGDKTRFIRSIGIKV